MKRFHVHVAVDNVQQAIAFYSALFAAEPSVTKLDYAKWMLDDPRVNFAISTRGRQPGLDHLGIQAESVDELRDIYARPAAGGRHRYRTGPDPLLLRDVREILDRRSIRHRLGNIRQAKAPIMATAAASAAHA
jgi:catechol 2,3-dioxygenase-like lactoylglutathione lyase family enzyme